MSGRRAIMLVARREIRERLRSKVFLASTLLMLLLVGGSTALEGALEEADDTVAVTAPAPAGLPAALERAARPFDDSKVKLRVVASTGADDRRSRRAGRSRPGAAAGSAVLRTDVDARPRRSQTRLCARSATSCRRHRSSRP
jgi:hypothetical protein